MYELPEHHEPEPGFWKKHGWWLVPLLVIDVVLVVWWWGREPQVDAPVHHGETAPVVEEPARPPGIVFGYPSGQDRLMATNDMTVYMPTASGRAESAQYGSVRTTQQGKLTLPSFHEGLDIAPLARDARNMPTDRILAAADGRVAYANRIAGNSNYGKYVVLVHDDPLGEIYSLYAHMEDVAAGIRPGVKVKQGDDLGRMGHSASTGIPISRAHLHFEVGVINNARFQAWFRGQKLKPDHGNYHGYNLTGIQPLDVYREQELFGAFNMRDYFARLEPAFTLVLRAARKPDYFLRYPALWQGGDSSGVIVMKVAEGGAPLHGRPATEEERRLLGGRPHYVQDVNESVLGRNGLRLITRRNGEWTLGRNGAQWLEILTYQ